jgi:anti-sigma-K factor RskA
MTTDSSEHDGVDQAALYVVDALTPAERDAFAVHLAGCAECRAEVASLSAATDALAHAAPQTDPPAALRARVLGSIAPAFATQPALRRASHRSLVVPWLAAAAALTLAIGLVAYTAALRARVGNLEGRLRDAVERAALTERQIAEVRRASADAQSQVAILVAPDVQRIDLGGQPPAPQASARAFWSRSRGLVFTAANLPPLPTGKVYQLWVLSRQPAPISAGLLRPSNGGRISTTFDTPADLPQPTGMAVTIEPEGGVAAPTGDKYLLSL